MQKILVVIQALSATLLIVTILLQQKGAGLSGIFGGESGGMYQTKRGMEKTLYYSTIVIAIVFFGAALINLQLF